MRSLALVLALAALRQPQGVSPADAREQARFDAVARAAIKAGFTSAMVVGHGQGAADALFALTAEHAGQGVLVVMLEPAGGSAPAALELEHDKTPADLGLRGVDFGGFLNARDLVDVEVAHRPFMLETSRTFSTHHIVRRQPSTLTLACTFDGGSSSSTSKGIGSMTSTRSVTVEAVPGRPTLAFDLRIVDATTEPRTNDCASATTTTTESRLRYELPASGACRQIPASTAR